jgi:hypothetical protein
VIRQQINLYPAELRAPAPVLSAATMVRIALLFFTGLLVWTCGAAFYGHLQRSSIAPLEAAVADRRARLAQLEAEVTRHLDATGLELRLAALRTDLAQKRELSARLADRVGRETVGFASVLSGLGRQRLEGVWLTGFALDGGGESLALRGRAVSGERLLRYLRKIGTEAPFRGREFRTFMLERDALAGGVLAFDVRTDREAATP